jgi:hypothetical protein
MVRTHLTDWLDETHEITCWGWRCVLCGEIIDRQILRNRARQSLLMVVGCGPTADWRDGSEDAQISADQGDTP